jgi:hypothetical protein
MNYEENELEDYARYMDYIRRAIIEENKDLGLNLKEIQISIGHIDKIIGNIKGEEDTWGFHYTAKVVKIPIKTKTEWIEENRYTQQISYNEWKRLQKIETRDKLLTSILDGLEPSHKEILKKIIINND